MLNDDFFTSGYADAHFLAKLGITRVGDMTGLDTIGIPVWFASRPNSRTLSVSQGKGVTHAQARISAVMEAAESAVAERPEDIVVGFKTGREMAEAGRSVVPFDRLMRCNADHFLTDHKYAWARGHDVMSGREVFAPYELVGLDMRAGTPWDHATFKMSSIGLAAGNDRAAVMTHALLEVIEHDATSTLDLFGWTKTVARSINLTRGQDAAFDQLVETVRAAGFEPRFFDITRQVPIPVVACFFTRMTASQDGVGAALIAGFACRPDAYDAAGAALLECVQSRATDIAGARDDIKKAAYNGSLATLPGMDPTGLSIHQIAGHTPRASLASAQERYDHVAKAVLANGIDEIYCFPLAPRDLGIDVVRMLVPNLGASSEGGITSGGTGLIDALLSGTS